MPWIPEIGEWAIERRRGSWELVEFRGNIDPPWATVKPVGGGEYSHRWAKLADLHKVVFDPVYMGC